MVKETEDTRRRERTPPSQSHEYSTRRAKIPTLGEHEQIDTDFAEFQESFMGSHEVGQDGELRGEGLERRDLAHEDL